MFAMAALFIGAAPTTVVRAQTAPDPSDVVIVLDFSASILDEPSSRNRFGAALERIADRVDATSSDLIAGDTTVSFVQFATRAIDYPRCTDLKLLGNPTAVAKFAGCLRSVAAAYRRGLSPTLTRKIGVDTNYVAAMERAAMHLPADAVRPAMILFTDGRHDVRGVPASQVRVVRERLFGSRSPFALLPVGMGLDPSKRTELEKSLTGMRIVRDMPPCVSGSTFDWPRVVFNSPGAAGNAVAVALQNATCTFTVEPPPAAPAPTVGAVRQHRAHRSGRRDRLELDGACRDVDVDSGGRLPRSLPSRHRAVDRGEGRRVARDQGRRHRAHERRVIRVPGRGHRRSRRGELDRGHDGRRTDGAPTAARKAIRRSVGWRRADRGRGERFA